MIVMKFVLTVIFSNIEENSNGTLVIHYKNDTEKTKQPNKLSPNFPKRSFIFTNRTEKSHGHQAASEVSLTEARSETLRSKSPKKMNVAPSKQK